MPYGHIESDLFKFWDWEQIFYDNGWYPTDAQLVNINISILRPLSENGINRAQNCAYNLYLPNQVIVVAAAKIFNSDFCRQVTNALY